MFVASKVNYSLRTLYTPYTTRYTKYTRHLDTCVHLHPQVEEMYAPEINDFVYITDSAYTAEEIKNCELKLLRSIK